MKRLICFFKNHKYNQEEAFLASFNARLMNKESVVKCLRCKRELRVERKMFKTVC